MRLAWRMCIAFVLFTDKWRHTETAIIRDITSERAQSTVTQDVDQLRCSFECVFLNNPGLKRSRESRSLLPRYRKTCRSAINRTRLPHMWYIDVESIGNRKCS